jgi:hypothetical protein
VRCALCIGEQLWSGSDDACVKVWALGSAGATGCGAEGSEWETETLVGHSDSVTSLCCCGHHVWSASADKTIRVWALLPVRPAEIEEEGEAAKEGGVARAVPVKRRRVCLKVIRGEVGGGRMERLGGLVGMGGAAVWGAAGQAVSVFDREKMELVRALAPAHEGHITQMTRVRQTETRILWSFSLSDKTLKIWEKETHEEDDMREVVRQLDAELQAVREQVAEEREEQRRWREQQEAVCDHLAMQMQQALERASASELLLDEQRAAAADMLAHLETAQLDRDAARAAEAEAKEAARVLLARCEEETERLRLLQEQDSIEVERLRKLLSHAEQVASHPVSLSLSPSGKPRDPSLPLQRLASRSLVAPGLQRFRDEAAPPRQRLNPQPITPNPESWTLNHTASDLNVIQTPLDVACLAQDKASLQRQVTLLSERASVSSAEMARMQLEMQELHKDEAGAREEMRRLLGLVKGLESDKNDLQAAQARLLDDVRGSSRPSVPPCSCESACWREWGGGESFARAFVQHVSASAACLRAYWPNSKSQEAPRVMEMLCRQSGASDGKAAVAGGIGEEGRGAHDRARGCHTTVSGPAYSCVHVRDQSLYHPHRSTHALHSRPSRVNPQHCNDCRLLGSERRRWRGNLFRSISSSWM